MSEEVKTLNIKAESRLTEMGFEVRAIAKAAIVTVEFDCDYEPEYVLAMLQMMPQIINDQMEKYTEEDFAKEGG